MNNETHKCEDCKRMAEDYGKWKLNVCVDCGHYYKMEDGELCPCRATDEAKK